MAAEKANLLLITTDTQRWDTLHCMGSDFAVSPNLDRLAEEGVLFTQAHTSSPVCMPARCSLLTGLHTPVHGCIENGGGRRTHLVTLPDLLKEQGYTTIMVGKTHFGPIPDSFDVVAGDGYRDWLGQQDYDPDRAAVMPERLHRDSYLTELTVQQMRKAAEGSDPFFAFCSLHAPHPPARPPGDWGKLYDDIPLPGVNYAEGEERCQPQHLKRLLGIGPENRVAPGESKEDPQYWREAIGRVIEMEHLDTINRRRRLYYGYAAFCDALVGQLIAFLDESGLRENTLVLFSSDHGQQNFDHGFNDKHNYYDESWHVPFIMSMPGTLPEGEKREFAIWNDIPTTLLGAAGTECSTMQGFDLFTALRRGEPSPRQCAVATLYKSCALATDRWKLAYYLEEAEGRLFDRVNDPQERSDLYDSPEHREIRDELLRGLLTWRSDITDLQWLQSVTMRDTGPNDQGYRIVAQRAGGHVHEMKGTDPELRLARRVREAEQAYEVSE